MEITTIALMAKRLRLSNLRECYKDLIAEAMGFNASYEAFLSLILERECEARRWKALVADALKLCLDLIFTQDSSPSCSSLPFCEPVKIYMPLFTSFTFLRCDSLTSLSIFWKKEVAF